MVDYELSELFNQDSVKKNIVIQFADGTILDNSDLYSDGIELDESICTESELTFGSASAATLSFSIANKGAYYLGQTLSVKIYLNGRTTKAFTLGHYKVVSEKLSADKSKKDIVAYDALYDVLNANVIDWYRGLFSSADASVSMKNFRDSFFAYFGITQKSATLSNDTMSIKKTIESDEITGSDVLNAILEANGVFGHIGRSGKFEYIVPDYDAPIVIDKYISAEYEDFRSKRITKLQIRQEEDDIGVTVGTGTNTYIIEGNFLMYGKSTAELTNIAQNIYDSICDITYYPAKISMQSNPCFEVGDCIQFKPRNDTNKKTIILDRTIKGSQALRDEIRANGTEKHSGQANSVKHSIIQLKGKSNVLKRTLEATISQIEDLDQDLRSTITQTANDIMLQIERVQSEIDGEVVTYNTDTNPTLKNYPAWDFTYNIPCNGTVQVSDDLRFIYTQESYQKNARSVAFNTVTMAAFRFVEDPTKDELNQRWSWQPIADGEYGYILKQLAQLEITIDGITATVERVEKNAVTTTTLESVIEQTAERITSTVRKEVQDDINGLRTEVSSMIEQKADSILAQVVSKTEFGEFKAQLTIDLDGIRTLVEDTSQGLTSYIDQKAGSIQLGVDDLKKQTSSQLKLLSDSISAKVSNSQTGESFSWDLTSTAWRLYANGNQVFRVNKDGAWISGYTTTATLQANYATIKKLDAEIITVNELIANQINAVNVSVSGQISAVNASIENLDAKKVNTTYLKANYITTDSIDAKYATIKSLNSVNGKIDNLISKAITTDNLSAQTIEAKQIKVGRISTDYLSTKVISTDNMDVIRISASQINAGTISADRIDSTIMRTSQFTADNIQSKFQSPTSGIITLGTMRSANYYYFDGQNYQRMVKKTETIGGKTITYMGF